MPLPFEQQPRESNKAFAAFSLYLNLGSERSLAFGFQAHPFETRRRPTTPATISPMHTIQT